MRRERSYRGMITCFVYKTEERDPMPLPQVSILIPCYNGEKFVAEAIESALGQTHSHVEVVVVDDGSTDNSVEVLKSFGDRIVFEAGPNQGACVARNRAFELSSGEYIQFLDADDKLDPRKLELQLPLLMNDQADMVLCKFGLFGDHKGERPEKRIHPEPTGDPFLYFLEFYIGTPAAVYRRCFVEKSGGFLPGLNRGQEADYHLRVAALNPRVAMVDDILVWVRMHDGDRISNRPSEINQIVTTLCHMVEYMTTHEAWTTERQQLVSKNLLEASRCCFATGDRLIAREGLRKAVELYPETTQNDRPFRKLLTGILGIEKAESVVHLIRTILG